MSDVDTETHEDPDVEYDDGVVPADDAPADDEVPDEVDVDEEEPTGAVVPGAPDDPDLPPDTDHADPTFGPDAIAEAERLEQELADAAAAHADDPAPPDALDKKGNFDADLAAYFTALGANLYDALSHSITTGGGPVHITVPHLGTGHNLTVRVSPEF